MATTSPSTTPFETGTDGSPLKWVTPSMITVAIATSQYASDQGFAPVTTPLTPDQLKLLVAATEVWESLANVRFVFVADTPEGPHEPDIRVGLADLSANTSKPNTMGFIGYTTYTYDKLGFLPDTVLTIDSPADKPVTKLADGDLKYTGFNTTMFQDFEHELGHAIGLDHNETDVTAIMYPTIGARNPVPNSADISAIQALYGAPTAPLTLSAANETFLRGLVSGTSLDTTLNVA